MPDDIDPTEEAARADVPEQFYCKYAKATDDKVWPTLCERDNKYATDAWCSTCTKRS